MSDEPQVSVLGTVGIRAAGVDVDLGIRLQRLLGALTIANGAAVSVDRLTDIVWVGAPPPSAETTLRSYVTRLRHALSSDRDLITRRSSGYVIELGDDELDSAMFEDELDLARQHIRVGDHLTAMELLTACLARWRGDAYAGFADEEWARPEAVRLEERRLDARETLVETRLALGLNEQAIAEVRALVEAEPLRERSRGIMMRALYATGRQVDALRAFDEYRRLLGDEVGLVPSPDLVELESQIALHAIDPSAPDGARGYALHERIGEGAFSIVRRASQPGTERDVAVKIIRAELADQPDFIRRFEVEARTIARLEHPNIVPIHDFWREPGAAYLVMRLLRGGSVEQLLRERGPMSREQVVRLLDDVGAALTTAHDAGIVHRDVRPANLLLDEQGNAYLADFGIALPTATAGGHPIVSPAYAAPEMLRGEATGPTADVLSLGVTVFEALTGRLPFADSVERAEIIRRQLSEPLPPVTATRTDLPAAIDGVLARATTKAPGDRHPTVAELVDELRTVLLAAGTASRPHRGTLAGARNPYLGLHAFDEQDADRYFGREALITELVEAVERRPLVVVVGPSGSGKSSVVRAGLVPALRRGGVPGSADWFVTTMVPGSDPIDAFETALLRVAVNPPASLREQLGEDGGLLRAIRRVLPDDRTKILVVVDQFEELFTQTGAGVRDRFLDELAFAVRHPDSPVRVVATLRADHYDAPLRHAAMADLVTEGTVTVRPMSGDELERAITKPAHAAGVDVEPALVAELVSGVTAQPSALPLLQFALTELFDRRVADVMLLDTHRELGGLSGALAARADRIVDTGDPADEAETRRIFGRLVTLGEGVEDTRRRALRSELGTGERTAWLLDAFVAARLLSTDRDPVSRQPTVEVAHEALLRGWPRLRGWLVDDRADLRTLHAMSNAADAWIASGRDDGELARGGRLEIAADLATRRPDWLDERESEWVAASRRAAAEERATQLAAAERDRRQNRRLRGLLVAAACLLVLAVVATAVALVLRDRAVDSAVAADTARDDADIERLIAQSAAQIDAAPDRAILLALEANRRRDDIDTQTAVHRAIATDARRVAVHPPRFPETGQTRLSAGGTVGVSWTFSGSIEWFEVATGRTLGSATTDERALDASLSGDGRVTVFARGDQSLLLARRDPDVSLSVLVPDGVAGLTPTLDEAGTTVAFLGTDDAVHVVDVETGVRLASYSVEPEFGVGWLALAADGSTVHIGWGDGSSAGFDVVEVATGGLVDQATSSAEDSNPFAWSLSFEGTLVVGRVDGSVEITTAESRASISFAHSAEVEQLAAGPDLVVSSGADDVLRFWSPDGTPLGPPLPVDGNIDDIAVGPGRSVVIALTGAGHMVVDVDGGAVILDRFPAVRAQVSPDHPYWETSSDDFEHVELRQLADGSVFREIDPVELMGSRFGGQAYYSPDGKWMLIYGENLGEAAVVEIEGDRYATLDMFDVFERVTGEPVQPSGETFAVRPENGGERIFFSTVGHDGRLLAARVDVVSGEIVDGPAAIPTFGPVRLLDDGRVVIGGNETGLAILGVDLDDPPVVVPDSAGLAPYHQDPISGRVLAAGFDGSVALLDPVAATVEHLEGATGLVYSGAFSPDGRRVAVTTLTDGVQVLDVESGRRLGIASGVESAGVEPGNGVRWTEDGTGVWTAPGGGPVLLAADPARWREIACSIVHRDLTAEEWQTFVSPDTEPVAACANT